MGREIHGGYMGSINRGYKLGGYKMGLINGRAINVGAINGGTNKGVQVGDTPPYLAGRVPRSGQGLPQLLGPTFDLAFPGLLADGVLQARAIKPQGEITPPPGVGWPVVLWGGGSWRNRMLRWPPAPPKCLRESGGWGK